VLSRHLKICWIRKEIREYRIIWLSWALLRISTNLYGKLPGVLKDHRHNIRLSGNKTGTGQEARKVVEKAETFATHLSTVFMSNPCEIALEEENKLLSDNTISAILDTPTKPFSIREVSAVIKNLNPKKMPNYDLITNQILQKLPEKGIKYKIHHATM